MNIVVTLQFTLITKGQILHTYTYIRYLSENNQTHRSREENAGCQRQGRMETGSPSKRTKLPLWTEGRGVCCTTQYLLVNDPVLYYTCLFRGNILCQLFLSNKNYFSKKLPIFWDQNEYCDFLKRLCILYYFRLYIFYLTSVFHDFL